MSEVTAKPIEYDQQIPRNAKTNILVVCNSLHHSANLINLSENLSNLHPGVRTIALCEQGLVGKFSQLVNKEYTQVISTNLAKDRKFSLSDDELNGTRRFFSLRPYLLKVTNALSKFEKNIIGKSRTLDIIINIIRETSLVCYLRQKKIEGYYTKNIRLVEQIFDQYKPSVVFSFGDRHIDIEVPTLIVAKSKNIKIILPYSTFSGRLGLLKIRQVLQEPKRWMPFSFYRFNAAIRLKNQHYSGYFYQHPSVLLALQKVGGLSANPWCFGNGLSDIVCVDNQHTLSRYLKENVPKEKLLIVGDMAYDKLHFNYTNKSKLRSNLELEYQLAKETPIVVLALPQFAEQGLMSWKEHWQEISLILKQLCKTDFNILVSLHPRVDPNNYMFLENEFPIHLVRQPLRDFLPAADSFVAINSSTVFWAALCAVPSIIMDYYGLDSSLFEHLNSVKIIQNREALSTYVIDSINGEKHNFENDWQHLSKSKVFDGQVNQRYLNLVLDSVSERLSIR